VDIASSTPDTPLSHSTALRLTGRDALAVLHRISTQFLSDLGAGESRATLFCDFRGRLLHRAFVARLADESVWLVRDDAPGAGLDAYVDRHVFREEVTIEDASERLQVRVRLDAGVEPGTLTEAGGVPVRFGVAPGVWFELTESAPAEAASAPSRVEDRAAWERRRVESGWPRHGHEIGEDFTPFEVGLAREVHLQKGCYTGQEALMRLTTYDSVRRRLARVTGPGAAPAAPTALNLAGERAGVLTSAIAVENGWLGLAVLTAAARETPAGGGFGARVTLEDGRALASVEPFPVERPLGLP
jgi:folate-binding protein YgfZ